MIERKDCLFCNTLVHITSNNSEGIQVKTTEFSKKIKEVCVKRKDDWAYLVLGRINCKMSNLHAAQLHIPSSMLCNLSYGKR